MDCQIKDVEVYAMYSGRSISSFGCIQQIGRARQTKFVKVLFSEPGHKKRWNNITVSYKDMETSKFCIIWIQI